ncbi:MAG: bifunctional [glutamate--ammonia ligase]-adenylyl-L-tyrosine phosphorylase/[glutamate--ammonia-ligase] adenylyltransferase [Thermodesulfobacteriota bacterium]
MKPYRLPHELSDDADNRWTAVCRAAEEAGVVLPEAPEFVAGLKWVLGLSEFVAHSCISSPEILSDLFQNGSLNQPLPGDHWHDSFRKAAASAADPETLGILIRRFRRREMVRIAWRDLAGLADLVETMAALTGLAEACIEGALQVLYGWQCRQSGLPAAADGRRQQLVVIGMGKLGGRELNFSSDIDLIFAYPEAGETVGGARAIDNDEFFTILCRQLVQTIGAVTPEGFAFRTDLRLRPYGESGPIVMSFDTLEAYYQQQGRDWERYAWIKARVVAGDHAAGRDFMNRIKPFVYRRYLDFGAFESLRRMKQNIELEELRKGVENNIKLGRGGIREIEFFGQVFQLIRGGVEPALQRRGIRDVLAALVAEAHIPSAVSEDLENAYVFLRRTENHLQELSDRQTHILPQEALNRLRLALSMGYSNWKDYRFELDRLLSRVHFHFNKLLVAGDAGRDRDSLAARLEGVWLEYADDEEGREILEAAGFNRPGKVMRLLEDLKNDAATRSLSNEGRERLDRVIPSLLKQVGESSQPDEILNRILDLIKTIEKRTCYLALLAENPGALVHLVRLAGASPWIVSFLARHPVLLDEFLDPRTLYAPPEKKELIKEINKKLNRIDPQDLEYQIEELCIFKQIHTLRIVAADVSGAIPLMRVSDHLSDIAETVVAMVVELCWRHLVRKHGEPRCLLDGKRCQRGFLVVAYGKFGGYELGYDSDLDLVFLHAGSSGNLKSAAPPLDNSQFFTRMGQRVIHIMTAHTPAGTLYETDMRLRPSGSSGLLVSHIEAFKQYQEESAWTWEHQALVRARVIYGDDRLASYFEQVRAQVLARRRDPKKLQHEISSMRARMRRELLIKDAGIFDLKQGPGGIVDIEFLVQYLVLLGACRHSELLKWTDNVRLLGALAQTGMMDGDAAFFLRKAYLSYRLVSHRLSLQNRAAVVPDSEFRVLRENVQAIWRTYIKAEA